jgi:hypothetical protein
VPSFSIFVLRLLETAAVIALAAQGFVAFTVWRESFRKRLIEPELCDEVS